MAAQYDSPHSPADTVREMEQLVSRCDSSIASCAEKLRELDEARSRVAAEQEQLIKDRQTAGDIIATLNAGLAGARRLLDGPGRRETRAHLHVVEEDDGPGTGGAGKAEVVEISGEKSTAIMRVISSDPGRDWSVAEIAARLTGIDTGTLKALRSALRHLRNKNALERVMLPGDPRAYYRLTANWKSA